MAESWVRRGTWRRRMDGFTCRSGLPGLEVGLSDLPNKNIRHSVKFEF